MGGDRPEPRIDLSSPECGRLRQQLNESAKYAWILQQHLDAGGILEEL